MIDPKNLRYLSSYSSLIREAHEFGLMAKAFLDAGDVKAWSYYSIEAQSAMDEATRRIEVQQGLDHGQRQRHWMGDFDSLTPLL